MTSAPDRARRLLAYVAPQYPALALVVALAIAAAALTALAPWPLKVLVDYALHDQPLPPAVHAYLAQRDWHWSRGDLVALAAGASLLIFAIHELIDAAQTMAWSRASQRMVYALAGDLFLRLQRLSLLFHAQRSVGDSLSRVTGDAWCVSTVTEALLVTPARQLMVLASVSVLAWQLAPTLTLVMVAAVPALATSAYFFGRRLKRAERRKRETTAHLTAFVHQVLGAMPVVQSFGSGARNLVVFEALATRHVQAQRSGALIGNAYTAVNGIALTLGIALVVFLGGRQVIAGAMTLGSLLVMVAYVRALDVACRSLLRTYGELRGAGASLDRVWEVLEAHEIVRDRAGARGLPAPEGRRPGHLVFEGVVFAYAPEHPVLRELSLEVHAGETLALVGASGAGKTTLASLVPRFFDPQHGRVLLDGADLRDIRLSSLRHELALVLQDPFIQPMTVAENIAYGKPGAGRDEIVAAAVAANAHGFIRLLAQGYDTVLDEQGANLSGGQRQRIAIARALLKDPRVLILDEPTSALDPAGEREVLQALERLMAGRTTLIIAHRLTTVRHAHRIAVLEHGRIVELGSHGELLAAGGRYARLYALSRLGVEPEVAP